jgi:hypothetical protein
MTAKESPVEAYSSDSIGKQQWVIPYVDQEPAFWEELTGRFGKYIHSVYFPMPGGSVASGRPPQPEKLLHLFLQRTHLEKTVLVNPIVLTFPVEQIAPVIIESLKQLRGDFGVKNVTVTSLSLARMIKAALPEYCVGASTLMGISTPAQILMVKEYLDYIVPENRLLRDLAGLKSLRQAFTGEIRLIVNEACLPGCPYRTQHFYEMAYSKSWPESLCRDLLAESPWLRMTGAWVLPRHLRFYAGLYDSLKLSGRVTLRDPSRYLHVLDAYIFRKDILPRDIAGGPASILNAMDMPDAFYEKLLHCNKDCLNCQVCRNYYEQISTPRK